MERYPDRKHIHIRCDKHTRDFSRLQMYSRILALGVLVRVLVDVGTFAVQDHVELLGSELHYVAIGKHDGDVYHRFSLLWLPIPRILPLYGPAPPSVVAVKRCRARRALQATGYIARRPRGRTP